jgi:hypothetical protein
MANKSVNQDIKTFVGKVEKELAHLDSADIRELTENLEDALLEKSNDEGSSFSLPNPKIYAEDLVEAAGLSSNKDEQSKFNLAVFEGWRNLLRYLSTLGPAWAIARGYLLYAVGFSYIAYGGIREIPQTAIDAMVLIVTIGLSIWLNIRKFSKLKIAAVILNVAMLPLTLQFANHLEDTVADYRYFANTRGVENSIMDSDGNLYLKTCAYDWQGNLLDMKVLTSPDGTAIQEIEEIGRGFICLPSRHESTNFKTIK